MHSDNHQAQNKNTTFPIKRSLCIALIAFIFAYINTQKTLFIPQNQQLLSQKLIQWRQQLCKQGIRLPAIACSTSLTKANTQVSTESLSVRFARLPNLSSAINKLQWSSSSEIDAVKLITTIKSMEHSRRHQSSENYKAVPLIAEKLLPIWQHYPLMVTAASCLYCGNTTRVLSELINTKTVMDERIIALSMTHPRLLRDIAPLGVISPEKLNTVTAVHAEFFSGGDSGTSIFIANALIAQQDYQRLRLWVSKGLNGGRALNQTDLSTIPFDIVVAAWQQGARQGYDQASLTRYLVAQGYRPALRWLVWLQGSEMKYLHTWGYQRQAEEYKKVLIDYTSFAIHEPNALALFYSKNWRNIHWDKEQQRWLF